VSGTSTALQPDRRMPARRAVPQSVGSGSIGETPGLASLRPMAIWEFLRKQPLSYLLVLVYLFFEYVRPQAIYESLLGPPYARVVIILSVFAFLLERKRLRFGAPEALLALFTLVIVASSIGAFYPSLSYGKLSVFLSWLIIYVLIANAVDTEERFLVLMLTFLLYSLKMSLFGTRSWAQAGFIFREWGTSGAPGFFRNSGEFGIQMCIFLPLMVAFIHALGDHLSRWSRAAGWAAAATAITGIVASSSRGALVGLAAISLWLLTKSRRKARAFVVLVALAGVVYAITPPEQKARMQAIGEDPTSVARSTYWKHGFEMINQSPILGIGYANWARYHASYYGTPALPHNIFVEAGAELGYTGLLAFVALIVTTFVVNRNTRMLARRREGGGRFPFYMAHGLDGAMVGFLATGFFVTVLYYPFFWINLALSVALNNSARNATPTGLPLTRSAARRARSEGGRMATLPGT
jgi:putative inorganic carbon (HCO3(-)) transporter